MIDTKSIVAMARHVFRHTKGYPDRKMMHPNREWLIGIGILVVIVAVGGVTTTQTFLYFQSIDSLQPTNTTQLTTFKQSEADAVVRVYRSRAQMYNQLNGVTATSSATTAAASVVVTQATTTATTTTTHTAVTSMAAPNNVPKPTLAH